MSTVKSSLKWIPPKTCVKWMMNNFLFNIQNKRNYIIIHFAIWNHVLLVNKSLLFTGRKHWCWSCWQQYVWCAEAMISSCLPLKTSKRSDNRQPCNQHSESVQGRFLPVEMFDLTKIDSGLEVRFYTWS